MQKSIIYHDKGREFRIDIRPSLSHMAHYTLYERVTKQANSRVNIFQWRYRDSGDFWVTDYPTIKEGAIRRVQKFLDEEAERLDLKKRWEEFENNC